MPRFIALVLLALLTTACTSSPQADPSDSTTPATDQHDDLTFDVDAQPDVPDDMSITQPDVSDTLADTDPPSDTLTDTDAPNDTLQDTGPSDTTMRPQLGCSTQSAIELVSAHRMNGMSPLNVDLTGDGQPDAVQLINQSQDENDVLVGPYRIDVYDDVLDAEDDTTGSRNVLNIAALDLNDDGQQDLMLASIWDAQVAVFFGPITQDTRFEDADLLFRAPITQGAMSTWFGASHILADVNADGIRDLIIGSPSYGEVICLGQLAPAVFFGPFEAGVRRYEDADRILDEGDARGDDGTYKCLGHLAWCDDTGITMGAPIDTEQGPFDDVPKDTWRSCKRWPLPLTDAPPLECTQWPGQP